LDLVFDSFLTQKSSNAEFESSSCFGQKEKVIVHEKDNQLNHTETKAFDQNTKTNFSYVHSQDLHTIQKGSDYRKLKQTSSSLHFSDISIAFNNNSLHIKRLNSSSKNFGKILQENDKLRHLSQNLTTLNEVQINSLFRKRILTNKEKKLNNMELIDLTNEFENENFA
jgi:hypothetical protein